MFIVVVLDSNTESFDCILTGSYFTNYDDAVRAVETAKKEDEQWGWEHKYKIIPLIDWSKEEWKWEDIIKSENK